MTGIGFPSGVKSKTLPTEQYVIPTWNDTLGRNLQSNSGFTYNGSLLNVDGSIKKTKAFYNFTETFNYVPVEVSTKYTQYLGTYSYLGGPVRVTIYDNGNFHGSTNQFTITRRFGNAPVVAAQYNGSSSPYEIWYRSITGLDFELFFVDLNIAGSPNLIQYKAYVEQQGEIVSTTLSASDDVNVFQCAVAFYSDISGNVGIGDTSANGNPLTVDGNLDVSSGVYKVDNVPVLSGTGLDAAVQVPVNSLGSGTGADNTTFWRGDGNWVTPTDSSSIWGNISGTLSNQTDLQSALDDKANDSEVVKLTGNQTIAGVKTFSSSPIVPTPTLSTEVTNKGYVDAIVNAAIRLQGDWNANTNTPDITTTTTTGFAWRVSVAGSTDLGGITDWDVGDLAVKTDTSWLKVANQDVAAVWGNISGTLANQTDLQNAFNLKADLDGATLINATVNGITLDNGGTASNYLDKTGNYSVPPDTKTFLGLTDTISGYTANRILFESGSGVADSNGLTFDGSTLKVLADVGIGTDEPENQLHTKKTDNTANSILTTVENSGTGDVLSSFLSTANQRWVYGMDASESNAFVIGATTGEPNLATDTLFKLDTLGNLTLANDFALGGSIAKNKAIYNFSNTYLYDPAAVTTKYTQYLGTYSLSNGPVKVTLADGGSFHGSNNEFTITRRFGNAPVIAAQYNGSSSPYEIWYRSIDSVNFELFFVDLNIAPGGVNIGYVAYVEQQGEIVSTTLSASDDVGVLQCAVAFYSDISGNVGIMGESTAGVASTINGNSLTTGTATFEGAALFEVASRFQGNITVASGTSAATDQIFLTTAGRLTKNDHTGEFLNNIGIWQPNPTFEINLDNISVSYFKCDEDSDNGGQRTPNTGLHWFEYWNGTTKATSFVTGVDGSTAYNGLTVYGQLNNEIQVFDMSDFGTNVSDVITLTANTTYKLCAAVSDSNVILDLSAGNIEIKATNRFTDTLNVKRIECSTLPAGSAITLNRLEIHVNDPSLPGIYLTGNTATVVEAEDFRVVSTGAESPIYVSGMARVALKDFALFGGGDWAIYLQGNTGVVLNTFDIQNAADIASPVIRIDGSNPYFVDILNGKIDVHASRDGVFVTNSLNTESKVTVNLLAFNGNELFDSTGLDATDPRVFSGVTDNIGYLTSKASIQLSSKGNTTDTTILAAGAWHIPVIASPTYTSVNRWSGETDGGITLTALEPTAVRYEVGLLMEPANSNKDLSAAAIKIGVESVVVTFDNTTNIINETDTPLEDGDAIIFHNSTGTLPAELSKDVVYYVVNQTLNSFQLAYTDGGGAIVFTDNGTGTLTYDKTIIFSSDPANDITAQTPREIKPFGRVTVMPGEKIYPVIANLNDSVNITVSKVHADA